MYSDVLATNYLLILVPDILLPLIITILASFSQFYQQPGFCHFRDKTNKR